MRKWLFFCLCGCSFFTLAQDQSGITSLTKVYVLNPGFEYEAALSPGATWVFNPGLAFVFGARYSSVTGRETLFAISPSLNTGFRYYYNLSKRERKGNSIRGNSGNYLSALCFVEGGELASSGNVTLPSVVAMPALAWGLQRTYRKNLNLNLLLGFGYYFARYDQNTVQDITPIIQLKLGYAFLKPD